MVYQLNDHHLLRSELPLTTRSDFGSAEELIARTTFGGAFVESRVKTRESGRNQERRIESAAIKSIALITPLVANLKMAPLNSYRTLLNWKAVGRIAPRSLEGYFFMPSTMVRATT